MALTDKLTAIANAIRAKTGGTDTLTLDEMALEISNIGGGADNALIDGSITEYSNETAENIKDYAFSFCRKLTKLSLPAAKTTSLHSISNCTALTSVEAPSLETIGAYAFYNDTALPYIDLPSVTSISVSGFAVCAALATVIIRAGTVCTLENANAFGSTPIANGTGYVYVPDNLVESYKAATNWATYAARIKGLSELPAEVTTE